MMGKILDQELEIESGRLTYRICGDKAVIVSARIHGSRVRLPDRIEDFPVTKLDKKAFLSCKTLKEIWLSKEIREIGDWAFAYCSNLEAVHLPRRNLVLGKGIFKECERLSDILHLDDTGSLQEQVGKLLGAVPIKLEADYLFTPAQAGEEEWLKRFDDKLKEFLARPDEDGYTKMVYCGEEDIVANMDLYLAERRRAKSRLCFLRLINDVGLEDEFRKALCRYLEEHTIGCASEAAWEVVYGEHGNEQEYYKAFIQAGCLCEENYNEILLRMGENYPEMKGYLMRCKAETVEKTDFFDLLSLDEISW